MRLLMNPKGMKTQSILMIGLLSLIWGASFLLIRVADASFPPLWIALLRSSLGGALLWLVLLARRGALPQRRQLPTLLVVAFFNNALPFVCFAWGEQVVPSNTAAVLNATTPIWTLLLGMAVHRRRAGRAVVGGVALGFVGVVLVVLRQAPAAVAGHAGSLTIAQGAGLISLGALGYAVGATIAKAKLQSVPPLTLAATQLLLAACVVLPFAALGPHPVHLRLSTAAAVAALGFAGSGLAYLMFFHLLRSMPATHTVAVTYLLPVWGIFWGVLAHESIGPLTYIGVLIVIAGLALMNLPVRPARIPVSLPSAGGSPCEQDCS